MKNKVSQKDLKNYILEQIQTLKLKESITGDIDMDFDRTNYSKDDYVKGVSDLEREALDSIKSKLADIVIDYAKIQKEDVKKIADFLMKTFGTTKPQLNKENAKKLSDALGLDSILSEGFQEGENILVKIIGRIKQLLGINIYAFVGAPLAGVIASIYGAPGFIIALIGGWALLGIFTKIMEKFGYGDENTDVAGIGNYNSERDIRNKENSYTMENKITKEGLLKYIKEQSQNLYNLHILKEEKNKIENDLKVLSEGKKKYSDKASNFIGKEISHLQKDKGYKHDRAVAAAINVAKDKGYKVPAKNESEAPSAGLSAKKKSAVVKKAKAGGDIGKKGKKTKLNEGLSEKGITIVQKWIEEKGSREAAVKMIDSVLIKKLGLSSSDLGDTAIFANGLDEIESMLIEGDYNAAYEIARDTAMEMIEDEGGGDLFGEQKLNEGGPKVSRDELMSTLKKMFPKAWFKPGEDFRNDDSENSTIWTGEGSYTNDGKDLFNYYSEDYEEKTYVMGVYKPLYNFLKSVGYYTEANDPGTYFIRPI